MQIQEVFDRRRFVFLDGGMGTQLQQRGLQPGQKPELAALEMPDVLTAIHRDYTAAGADILLANTFGANAKKLAGCGRSVEEVVSASAIYTTLMQTCNLAYDESIFIDDNKVNAQAAYNLGITGILYKNPKSFERALRACGIELD